MKKLALIAVLALAAGAASAANYSAFTTYDYDNVNSVSGVALHRGTAGVAAGFGDYGIVDAAVVYDRANAFGQHENEHGFELGYTNGVKFGKIGVMGHVAAGRLTNSHTNTLRVSVEGNYPVTSTVSAVAGLEHIRVDGDAVANRTILGADVAVTKDVSARVAYAHTNITGAPVNANGLSLAVNYKF